MFEVDLGKVVAKDYEDLSNKPKINGVELSGNKTLEDLGIASKTALVETNLKVDTIIEKADLGIKNTASGEEIYLTDSAEGKAVEYALYGKARQNGEPTPENPIEIEVSGESGSVEVKSTGKNLIPYPYSGNVSTESGITWTNENGIITANGTATSDATYYLNNNFKLPKGSYILSGCPSGGSTSSYRIQLANNSWNVFFTDTGNGKTVTLEQDTALQQFRIVIPKGVTANNLVFKPMLRLATDTDDTWQPYREPITATIPTENGLAGIKVSSNGNYTDQNGQQWICDEIVKYADGSGKLIQRIAEKTITSSDTFVLANQNNNGVYSFRSASDWLSDRKNTASTNAISTHSIFGGNLLSGSAIYEADAERMYFIHSPSYNTIYFNTKKATTVEEFHSMFDGAKIYYELAEPITTPLTAEQLAEISTFYPVTNISNDFDCGMMVKYNCDSKNYIDNQLALQARAREEEMMAMFLLLPEETQAKMIENDTNNLLTESEE